MNPQQHHNHTSNSVLNNLLLSQQNASSSNLSPIYENLSSVSVKQQQPSVHYSAGPPVVTSLPQQRDSLGGGAHREPGRRPGQNSSDVGQGSVGLPPPPIYENIADLLMRTRIRDEDEGLRGGSSSKGGVGGAPKMMLSSSVAVERCGREVPTNCLGEEAAAVGKKSGGGGSSPGAMLIPKMKLKKFEGPSEAEKKLDELTRQIEEEFAKQEESGAYLGVCATCKKRVTQTASACQAMGNLYHTECFRCIICGRVLRGKAFYNVNGKSYCEEDFTYTGFQQNAEKCTVCGHLIMETILQAMGKPYHPGCFRCSVCNLCLDNIAFTIDVENKIYCVNDYHALFSPVCAKCRLPIRPIDDTAETVRVCSMERDFHVDCYCCEDCGMQLTDEHDKRCYPLDSHLLCRACHVSRLRVVSQTPPRVGSVMNSPVPFPSNVLTSFNDIYYPSTG